MRYLHAANLGSSLLLVFGAFSAFGFTPFSFRGTAATERPLSGAKTAATTIIHPVTAGTTRTARTALPTATAALTARRSRLIHHGSSW